MPGMGGSSDSGGSLVVQAFHHALVTQGALILVVVAILFVGWNHLRSLQYRRAVARGETYPPAEPARRQVPEAPARRLLRIAFGVLWIIDGLLQLQPGMPLGLPSAVLQPSAATSPTWVQHLVGSGADIWARHPATAAASVVWIQLGIGALLLLAPRGLASRGAGALSAGWGLVVWSIGGAFGGIFAPGLTVLFGAPGAVVFYVIAGILLAFPERIWTSPRTGRRITGGLGVFLLAMAVLQAWPGRGSWQGTIDGKPGPLASMVASMAEVPQPHPLSSLVASFGAFDQSHGWGVNLFVVVALATLGACFIVGGRWLRPALIVFAVLAIADWILIEDVGVWGGTATDLNSMLPLLLLAVAGYVATVRPGVVADEVADDTEGMAVVAAQPESIDVVANEPPANEPVANEPVANEPVTVEPDVPVPVAAASGVAPPTDRSWWERIDTSSAGRAVAAVGALAVLLIGVAPMAAAAVDRSADPAIAESSTGPPSVVSSPAPAFSLVDQAGHVVSLSSLQGQVVVLAFLDPVCTTDCPVIAQELRVADELLGPDAGDIRFVAIMASRLYTSREAMVAFDQQEGLDSLPNWSFLTGPVNQLAPVWKDYGMEVLTAPAGGMSLHSDTVFVIDAHGTLRRVLNADAGDGGHASQVSFAEILAQQVKQVLHP